MGKISCELDGNVKAETRYITTEIIIKSDVKCDALVASLVNDDVGFYIMPSPDIGNWYLCIDPIPYKTANETINALCDSIERLEVEARREWDTALCREFYIGYSVSPHTPFMREHFSQSLLQRACDLGADIAIALYPS